MTRRETVIQALNHEETPVIPYHLDFTEQALEKIRISACKCIG